jgi:hypothetical protein
LIFDLWPLISVSTLASVTQRNTKDQKSKIKDPNKNARYRVLMESAAGATLSVQSLESAFQQRHTENPAGLLIRAIIRAMKKDIA